MPRHYRSCNLCEATCGVVIDHDSRSVQSIRGDSADTFSKGYVCPKVMGLADIYDDPDRLRTPLVRRGGKLVATSWKDAFDVVAARLRAIRKEHGPHAIGVYQGNPSVHNIGLLTFGQLLFRRLGTRNLFSATSSDQLPHMLSSLLMLGHQLLFPIPDVDRTDHFVILGANPVVSNGSLMTAPGMKRRLEAIQQRGGKVVVIDPRRTETARLADEHVFVRPGTDALLLLAMLHTLFDEKLERFGRLADSLRGEQQVRDLASHFPPERVAARTGVEPDVIRRLARELASAERGVCYGRVGVSTQRFGGLCSWLVNLLNLATGHFDEPGGAMFTTPAIDLVDAAARVGLCGTFDRYRSRVSNLPEFSGELPVSALAEEIETPGEGKIRALITSAGNPVLSIPNGARLEKALDSLDFMVSLDFYVNETTCHADVILPPTCSLEHDHYDLAFNVLSVRNVARYAPAVFERGPDQRHDWEIALELSSRLELPGGALAWPLRRALRAVGHRVGPRGLLDIGLRLGPRGTGLRRGGITLAALERQPHGVDFGPLERRLPAALHTTDRRIDLAPQPYLDDVARLEDDLDAPAGDLVLIGRRHLRSNNSWLHNSARLVKGKPRCTLQVHPDDAARLALSDGQTAEVRSRTGTITVPVEITEEVMPGVVSLPHGWGHDRRGVQLSIAGEHSGASINDITDEAHVDVLSGTAGFSGVPVEVRPA